MNFTKFKEDLWVISIDNTEPPLGKRKMEEVCVVPPSSLPVISGMAGELWRWMYVGQKTEDIFNGMNLTGLT